MHLLLKTPVLFLSISLLAATPLAADPFHPDLSRLMAQDKVDIQTFRRDAWPGGIASMTVDDLDRVHDVGLVYEKKRQSALQRIFEDTKARGGSRPNPSGTPPDAPGSPGAWTDIDDTYKSQRDLQAAAEAFEDAGYKVRWDTPDAFSVPEMDYTGFSDEAAVFKPGSPEAERYLRDSARFEDNVGSQGGKQWVEKQKELGKAGKLQKSRDDWLKQIDDPKTAAAERARLRQQVAKADDGIAAARRRAASIDITDPTGFSGDMMKKGAHHMTPADWCPPPIRFKCVEEPRQAAKAAARVLGESVENLTPEQQRRLNRLKELAGRDALLPSDPAAFEREAARLKEDIRRSFHEANQAAAHRQLQLDKDLLRRHAAAKASGDESALRKIEQELAERKAAARYRAASLDELRANSHVHNPDQTLHEWITGKELKRVERPGMPPEYVYQKKLERLAKVSTAEAAQLPPERLQQLLDDDYLRRIDIPGKPPEYVVNRRVAGVSVQSTLSEAEMSRAARDAARRNVVQSLDNGLPGKPRFSSVAELGDEAGKLGSVNAADVGMKALEVAAIGYAVYQGSSKAVAEIDRYNKDRRRGARVSVPNWRELLRGEKLKGWVAATAAGTAMAIGEVSGAGDSVSRVIFGKSNTEKAGGALEAACYLTLVCVAKDVGLAVGDQAMAAAQRRAIAQAQREGRAVTWADVLANLNTSAVGEQLGREAAQAAAEWAQGRLRDWQALNQAWDKEAAANALSDSTRRKILERLDSGGMVRLIGQLAELRQLTEIVNRRWSEATARIDAAVSASEAAQIYSDDLQGPGPQHDCQLLKEQLGDLPRESARDKASREWEAKVASRQETLNQAFAEASRAYGAASTAINLLDGELSTSAEQQKALQARLSRILGSIQAAVGGVSVLAELKRSVDAMANPVPIDRIASMAEAARGMRRDALEWVSQVEQRGSEEKACELPEAVSDETFEKAEQMAARALAACNPSAMRVTYDKLKALSPERKSKAGRLLRKLKNELSAMQDNMAIRDHLTKGRLEEAAKVFEGVKTPHCENTLESRDKLRQRLQQMTATLDRADRAIADCDRKTLRRLDKKFAKRKLQIFKEKRAEVAAALKSCSGKASGQKAAGKGASSLNDSGGGKGRKRKQRLHRCADPDVPVTGRARDYARIYGGGHTSTEVKGRTICRGSRYDRIKGGSLQVYSCKEKGYRDCTLSRTQKITSVKSGENGARTYVYDDGASWTTITPVQ